MGFDLLAALGGLSPWFWAALAGFGILFVVLLISTEFY